MFCLVVDVIYLGAKRCERQFLVADGFVKERIVNVF